MQPFATIDAFTDEAFGGNPAAVCVLDAPREAVWYQHVAREMNLSETAYVTRRDGGFGLRWFTPTQEVPICGHATLAAAHLVWEDGILARSEAIPFHTRSGVLTAALEDGWIRLDFPSLAADDRVPPPGVAEALGTTPVRVAAGPAFVLAELASEDAVRSLAPDFTRVAALGDFGLVVTARSERRDADFVSRFFAPQAGIPEDPATGSAHCMLGPWWARALGRTELTGRQLSARGAIVRVRVRDDRVDLLGRAVTVVRGTILA